MVRVNIPITNLQTEHIIFQYENNGITKLIFDRLSISFRVHSVVNFRIFDNFESQNSSICY